MKGPRRHHWRQRRGYHHGNLKEVLLEAARQLIEDRGPEGFSLTEAARLAGVSAAAPYRHFRDREALLSEVARTGFERFAHELDLAWDEGRPSPIQAFTRLGRAYLQFARTDPASYSAMFEAGLLADGDTDLRNASDQAFAVLRRACMAVLDAAPGSATRPPGDLMSLHMWALSHGISTLFRDGKPGRGKVPMASEDILEAGMLIYLKGLGVIAKDA